MSITQGNRDELTVKQMQNARFKGAYTVLYEKADGTDKGYEKTKEVIKDWSPNNVKRLYIGVNEIGIQYYIGKTGVSFHLILPVKDFEKFTQAVVEHKLDITKSKSVLLALIARRQFSNLEAIIFTDGVSKASVRDTGSVGMVNSLLPADINMQTLSTFIKTIQKGTTWQSKMYYKFPRLAYICYIPAPFEIVTKIGGLCTDVGGQGFLQCLKQSLPIQPQMYYQVSDNALQSCVERCSTYPFLYEMDAQIAEFLRQEKDKWLVKYAKKHTDKDVY